MVIFETRGYCWLSAVLMLLGHCAGMLTALHAWDATPAATSSSSGQQLSILQELAASEMCPMRALDYAACLDWSSARPSLGAVDPARVAQFRAFVQQVKVQKMLCTPCTVPLPSACYSAAPLGVSC